MGLFWMLVRLFAKKGRSQSQCRISEPLQPLFLRTEVTSRAIGIKPLQMEAILQGRCGAASSGGLRLCPHIYNTQAHIQRALDGVASMRDCKT